jgi:hypothetical protein
VVAPLPADVAALKRPRRHLKFTTYFRGAVPLDRAGPLVRLAWRPRIFVELTKPEQGLGPRAKAPAPRVIVNSYART